LIHIAPTVRDCNFIIQDYEVVICFWKNIRWVAKWTTSVNFNFGWKT